MSPKINTGKSWRSIYGVGEMNRVVVASLVCEMVSSVRLIDAVCNE